MYFKFFQDGTRKAVDLNDVYEGQSLFIIGGSPSLKDENLELLREPGVLTLAMNNAAHFFKPNFWVGGDRPECYAESILVDSSILKFANYGKRDFLLKSIPWKYYPATLFYACVEHVFTMGNFLDRDYRLCWWKNTFFIAIQLAWRLGFRNIYLLGCEFKMEKGKEYAWKTELRNSEIDANKRLYSGTATSMSQMKPMFDAHGFNIKNCCETSKLVPIYGYITLEQAVAEASRHIPKEVDTRALPHSLRKDEKK